ncbi:MAG: HD-GYP domain-containing protein [Nitrospirae bacterium]|nr:MAG: HD-GYP domain-containing protein [Nitrospirota bacterium]
MRSDSICAPQFFIESRIRTPTSHHHDADALGLVKKRIPLHRLKPGMYIASLDVSWFKTPFLRHKWRITREDEIRLLGQYGIQEVTIDTDKGFDVEETESPTEDAQAGSVHDRPASGSSEAPPPSATPVLTPETLEMARAIRSRAIAALDMLFHQVETGHSIHTNHVRRVVSTLLEGLFEYQHAMLSLIQMRRFDHQLSTHVVDTSVLALALGQVHALDPTQLKTLGVAALLHDVGQLRLPRNLLRKRSPYTEEERRLMALHPEIGVAITNQFSDFPDEAKQAILEHHERLNGTGYPRRITQPHRLSQLLAIADTYDALISGRCTHLAIPPAHALGELYRSAIQGEFDATLVQQLIRFLGVYPIGSLVELNTGERGVVVWVHPHQRLKPTVKLITDAEGKPYATPVIVDLSTPRSDEPTRTITRALDPDKEHIDVLKLLKHVW